MAGAAQRQEYVNWLQEVEEEAFGWGKQWPQGANDREFSEQQRAWRLRACLVGREEVANGTERLGRIDSTVKGPTDHVGGRQMASQA